MNKELKKTIILLVIANMQWAFILSNFDQLKGLEKISKETTLDKQSEYLRNLSNGNIKYTGILENKAFITPTSTKTQQFKKIVLPSISKEAPIFHVKASLADDVLNRGVVLLDLEGKKKGKYIYGHSSSKTPSEFQYIFTKIPKLNSKSKVAIESEDLTYIYSYKKGEVLNPEELNNMEDAENILYLITCYPFNTTTYRYVVKLQLERIIENRGEDIKVS